MATISGMSPLMTVLSEPGVNDESCVDELLTKSKTHSQDSSPDFIKEFRELIITTTNSIEDLCSAKELDPEIANKNALLLAKFTRLLRNGIFNEKELSQVRDREIPFPLAYKMFKLLSADEIQFYDTIKSALSAAFCTFLELTVFHCHKRKKRIYPSTVVEFRKRLGEIRSTLPKEEVRTHFELSCARAAIRKFSVGYGGVKEKVNKHAEPIAVALLKAALSSQPTPPYANVSALVQPLVDLGKDIFNSIEKRWYKSVWACRWAFEHRIKTVSDLKQIEKNGYFKSWDTNPKLAFYLSLLFKRLVDSPTTSQQLKTLVVTGQVTLLEEGLEGIDPRSGSVSISQALIGSHNDKEFNLKKTNIPADGNCGFTTLGIARKELADSLKELSIKENVRERLCDEVYEAFITQWISAERSPGECSRFSELKTLRDEKQVLFDSAFRDVRNAHPTMPAFSDDQKGEEIYEQSIQWLASNSKNEDLEKLRSAFVAREQANTDVKNFCKTEQAYIAYCTAYTNNGLWLGYQSAIVFAEAKNLSLYIWENSAETGGLRLKASFASTIIDQPITHHMLFSRGNHFDRLDPIPIDQEILSKEHKTGEQSHAIKPIIIDPGLPPEYSSSSTSSPSSSSSSQSSQSSAYPKPVVSCEVSLLKLATHEDRRFMRKIKMIADLFWRVRYQTLEHISQIISDKPSWLGDEQLSQLEDALLRPITLDSPEKEECIKDLVPELIDHINLSAHPSLATKRQKIIDELSASIPRTQIQSSVDEDRVQSVDEDEVQSKREKAKRSLVSKAFHWFGRQQSGKLTGVPLEIEAEPARLRSLKEIEEDIDNSIRDQNEQAEALKDPNLLETDKSELIALLTELRKEELELVEEWKIVSELPQEVYYAAADYPAPAGIQQSGAIGYNISSSDSDQPEEASLEGYAEEQLKLEEAKALLSKQRLLRRLTSI